MKQSGFHNLLLILKLELLINSVNNNFIFESKIPYNLNTLWTYYFDVITDIECINILKNINFFKSFFKILSKYILYYNINKKFIIYKSINNKTVINDFDYFNWFEKYKYIYPLILIMNKIVLKDIKKWFV